MHTFLALLRGINVGGNSLIRMEELRSALSDEFRDVRTYIQSGNVILRNEDTDRLVIARRIEDCIKHTFALDVATIVFDAYRWQTIVRNAPKWWGQEPSWKHNILVLTEPMPMDTILEAYGALKPDIELLQAGDGVLYQSLPFERFGQTTGGKLAYLPIYKKMTIRNYNTATKLSALLSQDN